jgi:SET domain-containing protein
MITTTMLKIAPTLGKAAMQHSELVCVKKVKGKGRGVFARAAIRKGTIIEQVPVLVVPIKNLVGGLENEILRKYFYIWTRGNVAVSLGYGSLYNHSYTPNADYEHGNSSMIYRALRHIAAGEEITINYNGDPKDLSPVGFEVK